MENAHIPKRNSHTCSSGVHTGRHRSHAFIFYMNCRHVNFRHCSCDFLGSFQEMHLAARPVAALPLSGHSQRCPGWDLAPTTAGTPASQVKIPHHVLDEQGSGTYRRVLGEGD